ncbi:unnamed protein product, partial [Porites lobata]
MPNCNHEEADTSIVVHVPHALQQGLTTVQVRTVDTDVVVVLIGVFHMLLLSQPKADICVPFGVGKNYRLYSISALSTSLGTKRSQARDFWMRHNLCFLGKRKENFCKIERLIVLVYDKTSTSLSINQTRRELFCLKNVTMESL